MTEASNPTAAASVRADDLSIVLFGLPAAGKSSLLGALAQAAQAQEHLLHGRLTDVSHGLDELRRRLYEENSRRTAEEVVPYPVDFEPFGAAGGKGEGVEHVGAVFIDCDGRVANDLLVRRQALAEDSPEGTLAREVSDADTLVLAIDASAPPAQVEADFAEFDRFLRQMEITRSERAEVGGLPVFLVLTKCDLLAQAGDTAADWMERLEQHKRDLDTRFRRFLARREQEVGPLPFGRIDLRLWATAVKRPALAGSPAKAREPYGVAELFRQCLEQAAAFRGRQRQSSRRLFWTVSAAGGIVALMATMAIGFTVRNLDTRTNALRDRVQLLRNDDMPAEAERLHASLGELRRRAQELRAIRNDPQFDALPADQQQLIHDRLDELEAYLLYFNRLNQSPRPRDAHTERALREIKEQMKTELALPREAWKDTEAGRLHGDRLQDAQALDTAVQRAADWYRDSTAKAENLRTFGQYSKTGRGAAGVNWDRWTVDAETMLRPDYRPPFSGPNPVPGAATTMTYDATVLRFEEVLAARSEWEGKKGRLQRVLDFCAALGLATPAAFPRGAWEQGVGVLVIPRRFTLAQARERRNALELAYSRYKSDFVFENVPEAIRPVVDQAAHTSYEHLLGPGRAAVLKQLEQAGGGAEETPAHWQHVRNWLRDPKELEDWRVLAGVLIRLHDPSSSHMPEASDPVNGLAEFLDRGSFPITIRRVTLEIPETLERKPAANANLSIYHPATVGENPALILQPFGEGERDPERRVWTYSFRVSEERTLTYRPGDALWATLPLRDDWMFTWVRSRGLMYQFERLTRPPRLHKIKEATTSGTLEEEVRLTILPTDGVPRLPDLVPVVRLQP
ncbi:MAG: hypothetical protein ACYC3I_21800 [Gemmataceae bacterium]